MKPKKENKKIWQKVILSFIISIMFLVLLTGIAFFNQDKIVEYCVEINEDFDNCTKINKTHSTCPFSLKNKCPFPINVTLGIEETVYNKGEYK